MTELSAEEKLNKMTQDFLETTQKLFEREKELKEANQKLQEIESIKSEFVAVAAHQLRTPLTGVKWSYLTLLDKATGPLNEEQRQIVEKGLETIEYAINTINDLLNTSRLEEAKTDFNFSVQPIGSVIREVIEQHKSVIAEKKIKLQVDFPLDSSLAFRFDKEKITIVFDNLIANAIKYTPAGGTVSLKALREEKFIRFKIKDTGIGIPKAEQNRVFSKFFRAKNAVSFETYGTGLGLYVAKSIVEKHGGTITLDSAVDDGTTVIFTLPLKKK